MYQVYILKSSKSHKYYIGHTDNLDQRLKSHNYGKVRSSKAYRPWQVIYTEKTDSKQAAYKREMQIKSYKGGNAFKKIITR